MAMRGSHLSLAMSRLETLERIATLAQNLRDLEIMVVNATDTRRVMDSLTAVRRDLDDALEDLRNWGRV